MTGERDAVVIGAGHNGLVAAFYLARAGMRPLVLERRDIVGGACVTEEFAPGYRASTGAYVLSMLRAAVWRDLRLRERGIVVDPAGPSLNVFGDGSLLSLDDDLPHTVEEIRHFSGRDAARFPDFEGELAAMAEILVGTFDTTPPDPALRHPRDLGTAARLASVALRRRRRLADVLFLLTTSVTQYLDERFESDHVKAAIGWHAINDSLAGPSTPGTAFVLLHDHASEEPGGGVRQWGFVRGGIGRVTEAMAEAAREAGAEVRTGSVVRQVITRAGRAEGVVLEDGAVIRAPVVVSNADPKHTLLGLVDEGDLPTGFVASVRAYRCQGTSIKINLAVAELPRVRGVDGNGIQAYHRGVMEVNSPLSAMDLDQALARRGVPAPDAHIELCFPTVHDPSLAPDGRHIVTIDVNSQPYQLSDGSWDDRKEAIADRVVQRLGDLMPNLPGAILHRQVLSPLDLERLLGITGGHALHGDMAPDQLFFLRPVRGYADYRTPIRGLYLCGAGTHPGGGVSGANGRNCAREVLRDRAATVRRRKLHI